MSQSEPCQLHTEPGKEGQIRRVLPSVPSSHCSPEHKLLRAEGLEHMTLPFLCLVTKKSPGEHAYVERGLTAMGCGGANNLRHSARPAEAMACGICRKDLGLVLSLEPESLPGPLEYGFSVSSQRLRFEEIFLCLWHSWEVAKPLGRVSSRAGCALERILGPGLPLPPLSVSLLPGYHNINTFVLPCPPVKKFRCNPKQKSQCSYNVQFELNKSCPLI